MNEFVKDALLRYGIAADESEVAILADGYAAAHGVALRLHEIPVGAIPPASLLNPAPHRPSQGRADTPST